MNSGTQNKGKRGLVDFFDDLLHVGHCLVYFLVELGLSALRFWASVLGAPGFGD